MKAQPIVLVLFLWTGFGMILTHFLGVKKIFNEQDHSLVAGLKFGLLGPLFWCLLTLSGATAIKRSLQK